jgi:ATP-dependent DNA helicase RecQ
MFRLRLPRMKPTLVAVDEAHCISQWGYDFRPSYLRIAELRPIIPSTPILAITASATEEVIEDIMANLRFTERRVIRSSFARPNISYSVRHVEDKDEQLLRVIRNVAGAGIVYMRTREGVEELALKLSEQGIAAVGYHGGMAAAERAARQEEWMNGTKRIMVATNAFGMGIDKADVRFVVHYSICSSIENYYQETGRAGRDSRRSYAVLLVSPDDKGKVRRRFVSEYPSLEQIRNIYEALFNYLQIAIGEGKDCSFDFDPYDFGKKFGFFPPTALSAIKILQSNGYMTLSDESDHPARVMFCVSRDDLYRLRVERLDLDHFLRVTMRMYNGLFTDFKAVDEQAIATVSGYSVERVKELFKILWRLRIVRYIPAKRTPLIFFPEERLPTQDVYIAPATYKLRKELAAGRWESVFDYADNSTECRSVWLRRYFGEQRAEDCGVCDVCLARRKKTRPNRELSSAVLFALRGGGMSVKEIVAEIEADPDDVIEAIDELISKGTIAIDSTGRAFIKNLS